MLGLFGTLNLGARSLEVQQQATEVAGQNLANVNNTAYSRQQLNIQTSTDLETPQGEEGTGVEAVSITSVTSAILNSQIQSENSVTGSLNSQQTALQNAEAELGEQLTSTSSSSGSTSSTGLATSLSSFFNSVQNLTANPTDVASRQAVIASGQNLAETFNTVSAGLTNVTTGLNTSITNDVAAANQDLSDIASLNQQIITAEAGGGTAPDLTDLREQKLEDLSSKLNVNVTPQTDGAVNISVAGVSLVSGGSTVNGLQTMPNSSGNLMVGSTSGSVINLTGGSLEGSITARDGAVASLQSSINTLASQLITQVNNVYSAGYDLNGNTGANFFTGTGSGDIAVSSTLVADPTTLQASDTTGANANINVAQNVANLANQTMVGLNNQTFSQNYALTVASLGSALSSVNDQVTNSSAVSQMLSTQKSSLSGVSTDEEMTNLISFQKAYEASAELITTVNQMLETLVTMKTV